MSDQAEKLRRMIGDAAPGIATDATLPPMIVVTGGKGGVGTTTVAINLAAALAQMGRRTVLVDVAPHADAAQLIGVDVARGASLDNVIAGACSAADALSPGPAGIALLAGRWAAETIVERSSRSFNRLREQLASLEDHADTLVVDSGSGVDHWTRQLWKLADLVLLVTKPDDVAVMDAYATIKWAYSYGSDGSAPDVRILVNECNDTATSVDAQSRLSAACRRFLGLTVGRAPRLPRHVASLFDSNDAPLAWNAPSSPFGRSVHQLGRFATDVLSQMHFPHDAARELSIC